MEYSSEVKVLEKGGFCRFCGSYQPQPCFTDAQEARCPNGYKKQKIMEDVF